MFPFTRDQFFAIFAVYNAEIWPAAILAYPLALMMLALAWHGGVRNARLVSASLAIMWGFVGVAYHGLYFSRINLAAPVFAAAFLLQALLFANVAATGRGIELAGRSRVRSVVGLILILYAMIAYPLIGLLAGERYPAMPLFGVAPCPLLIFTFGLYMWASRVRWWLWIVPLLWSLVGGGAFFLLAVPQDWGLPASALAAVALHLLERTGRILGPVARDGSLAADPGGMMVSVPLNSPSKDLG